MGKERLSQKCSAIIPHSKEYFPFSFVEPFGYNSSPNEGTITFWGNFPISPKIGGRGKESNNRILRVNHTPGLVLIHLYM